MNINPILDLLKSDNREDFELGVNILELLQIDGDAINLNTLSEEFEYSIIGCRLKRRKRWITEYYTWKYRHYPGWEEDKSWDVD